MWRPDREERFWAWQKLLNLEPWDHQTLQCASGKYSSRFGRYQVRSGRKTEAAGANSVTSMEILTAAVPLTSGTKYTSGTHEGNVSLGSVCLSRAAKVAGALGQRVPPWLPPSRLLCLGRWFPQSGSTQVFAFLLNLHFCVMIKRCSMTLPFCTLLGTNYIPYSLSVGGQIFGSRSGCFEGPVDFYGLELSPWRCVYH